MAYEGMFVDRSPYLRPAGQLRFRKGESVENSLVHEINENEVRSFVCKTGPLDYKLPPTRTNIYKWYSDARECLQPEKEHGLYHLLKREFQDTVYESYWKKELGRVPDPSPMLPAGMDLKNVCFGKPSPALSTAAELINPPKPYTDVIEESRIGHELYKRTHQDYDPGEQIQRNYVAPFNKELVYGKNTPSDPGGRCVKMVMKNESDDNAIVSKILADFKNRTESQNGKVNAPNNNILCVPKDHAFGKQNEKELFGAGGLMKDSPPCLDKFGLHEEIAHINALRLQIKKKKPPFPHRDFLDELYNSDVNRSGIISLQGAYRVLSEFEVFPEKHLFENLLLRLNILSIEKCVAYEKMSDLLNVNIMFPEIGKIEDVPKEFLYFETNSQVAQKYHYKSEDFKNAERFPKAGIPLGQYLSIDSLLRPANFEQFFLEPRDLFMSRSPEFLKKLLHRLECDLNEEKFNTIWNKAQDEKGCVSVSSFLKALTS